MCYDLCLTRQASDEPRTAIQMASLGQLQDTPADWFEKYSRVQDEDFQEHVNPHYTGLTPQTMAEELGDVRKLANMS